MNKLNQYVVFNLDEQRFALRLFNVERIIRAVEVTPLPKAPDVVLGVINVQGRIISVINIRKKFGLPERELNLSDQLIITQAAGRTVALVADAAGIVVESPEQEVIQAENIFPGIEYVDAVAKHQDGIIHILNFDKFLSLEEENTWKAAVKKTKEEDRQ